jgi:hypothetical protein
MRPPAFEFRLFLDVPGESWNYIVKRSGEVVAASDGDDHYSRIGEALKAALLDAQETIKSQTARGQG